jgi:hypothetical protein
MGFTRRVMTALARGLILLPGVALLSNTANAATSVSQYGITWQFDRDYQVGTFVNGDYYVVDPGSGVTVSSVSPGSGSGQNGSQVNPVSGGNHGFDSGARSGYSSSLQAKFPLRLVGGDALVSTISLSGGSAWDGSTPDSKALLQTAAVLTVMRSAPPSGSFRPSYVDRQQTLYNVSSLNRGVLPGVSTSSGITRPGSHGYASTAEYLKRGIQRPWLLFVHEWPGRDIHPAQNMFGYQRPIGEFLSELYMYLMTDLPIDDQLLIYTVQLGIDYHHVGVNGNGDSSYYVMPSLMAGLLLNNSDMLSAFSQKRIKSVPRDYPDFYFWPDHNSSMKSSIVPVGQTYNGYTVFFRNNLGTNREFEHLHPSEWDDSLDHSKDNSYRLNQDSHPHVGMVLAARMLGLQEEWAHDATFAYVDRWMVEDYAANSRMGAGGDVVERSGSNFIDSMWAKYRGSGQQPAQKKPEPPKDVKVSHLLPAAGADFPMYSE